MIRRSSRLVVAGLTAASLLAGLASMAQQAAKSRFTPPVHAGPPPVNAQTKQWWAFQPVKPPAVPAIRNPQSAIRNPIDAFILAKLQAAGLKPAPRASRAVLIRRAYYDLLGLPPTPEEVRAFVADPAPDAWPKLVDRLLASPHYGERWARHWMDLVRYAESNSFERDDPKPFVWRYRDYLINSFNSDKPYTQFIREQLAGDEMAHPSAEQIIATGYYRLCQWDDEPADPLQARYDELDDIVATTGQVFLGLTVNCGRCHDHKIDPFPQKDYYRLLAFFQGVQSYGVRSADSVMQGSLRPIGTDAEKQRYTREHAAWQARMEKLDSQLAAIDDVVRPDLEQVEKEEWTHPNRHVDLVAKRAPKLITTEQATEYAEQFAERERLQKSPPKGGELALCVSERAPEETHVLMRGNPHLVGDRVEPGFPAVLSPPPPVITPTVQTCGRRTALAEWVASPANPLTARVIVNRVWQFHFGRGIVRTPSNFGFQGATPTHPELLDWLASRFIADGWSLKKLHRLIMLSDAYQRASTGDVAALKTDPENDLFWRFDMRRLEAEELRDSILAVNGTLNPKMGGPSIYPTLPPEVLAGQSQPGHNWNTSIPEEQRRRSVYIHIKRSVSVPLIASFDGADTDSTCPVRFVTTQPTQALTLMNSTFLNEQASLFAAYLRQHAGAEPAAQVRLALWRVMQREPTAAEIDRGLRLIRDLRDKHHATDAEALTKFCLVALNLNEFVYLD